MKWLIFAAEELSEAAFRFAVVCMVVFVMVLMSLCDLPERYQLKSLPISDFSWGMLEKQLIQAE